MERTPLPSPLPARASQGEGAEDFSDGVIKRSPRRRTNFYWPLFGRISFSTLAVVVGDRIARFPGFRSRVLQGAIRVFDRFGLLIVVVCVSV